VWPTVSTNPPARVFGKLMPNNVKQLLLDGLQEQFGSIKSYRKANLYLRLVLKRASTSGIQNFIRTAAHFMDYDRRTFSSWRDTNS
jgi:hypothetical protein